MHEADPPVAPRSEDSPIDAVRTLAEDLTRLVGLARVLTDSSRAVDLTGLDDEIGLLCAKTLDLPPDEGRRIRPRLIALFGSIEGLSRALSARGPPSG
jgi:hypothetical protein